MNIGLSSRWSCAGLITAVGVVSGHAATFRTIALNQDTVPGLPGEARIGGFRAAPSINDAGQVVFPVGSGFASNAIVSASPDGSLAAWVTPGTPALGLADEITFSGFGDLKFNDAGELSFNAALSGPGVTSDNSQALLSGGADQLRVVSRRGGQAPGLATGVSFGGVLNQAFNNMGQTAFVSNLTGTGVSFDNDQAVFSEGGGGGLQLVARRGDPVPGLDPEFFIDDFSKVVLDDSGRAAFYADLNGVVDQTAGREGVFLHGPGGLLPVAVSGDQAPGLAAGINYGDVPILTTPALNNTGQIAFLISLTGSGVTSGNNAALFSDHRGGLQIVVREGGQAAGLAAGLTYQLFEDVSLNDSGKLAFRAFLRGDGIGGGNDELIYMENAQGQLQVLAREGTPAPGLPDGIELGFLKDLQINDNGQAVFRANLVGDGLTFRNDSAFYAADASGAIQLIVREGDLFDVDDDPTSESLRIITGFEVQKEFLSSNSRPALNDRGELAFLLRFEDGSSGVFVADLRGVLVGDYNGDGFVSQGDLDLVLLNWGDTVAPTGFDEDALPGGAFDGLVSQNELDGVLLNWGNGTPPGSVAIPEPTTLALWALACVGCGRSRRRR